ncbi:MAG: sialate O-acetylesterase [Muribaculaceae bacterium]|nr:sialate O-acetylesterase [Muribaculaceae bacterium]
MLGSLASGAEAKKKKTDPTPVKVGCIGNSITYGYGVENRQVNSYPARLQDLLGEGYDVRNFGRNGATLTKNGHRPYIEQEEFAAAMEFAPDLIVMHLGINDTEPRDYPHYGDEFVGDYLALIDSFKSVNPNVRVIIANLTPLLPKHFRYKSGTRAWRDSIRNLIPIVAKVSGSELIDFGPLFRDRPDLIPDAIHPNTEGASMMADLAASAITGNFGGLKLPEVYADGMVLQRNKDLKINGTANAGEKVTVTIGDNTRTAVASNDGQWSVTMPPMRETTGLTMTVKAGNETLTYNDVAVGEVWIASGQSNMEFRLKNASSFKDDKENLNDPLLRLFDMKPVAYTDNLEWTTEQKVLTDKLQHYLPTKWRVSNEETAPEFSAVAWYFGRMLRDSLNVPVGIISNAIGGSPAESWVDIETLEHNIPEIFLNFRQNDYLQPWVQKRIGENTGTDEAGLLHRHPYEPSYLFAAGIRPLGSFPVAGTIWYQGESNAHNIEIHEVLFPLLVQSWRENWEDDDMPFIFTQLSSINRPSWPWFRDSQRRMAKEIPGVAMAVSSDRGDSLDVHPRDKKMIGHRLGRQALNKVYKMKNVVPEGPTILKANKTSDNKVTLSFENAEGLTTSDGQPPITFEVAEYEGVYYPASAQIVGNEIILSGSEPITPKIVRYGWQPFTRANLVNGEGLPASTFKVKVK